MAQAYVCPPIVEAILHIQFEQNKFKNPPDLLKFVKDNSKKYPEHQQEIQVTGTFKLENGTPVTEKQQTKLSGFHSFNKDKTEQFRVKLSEFSFHKLKPYNGWDLFSKDGLTLWHSYAKFVGATKITRISLRFINRIELPIENLDFDNYLKCMPRIPNCLPQKIGTFLVRGVMPGLHAGESLTLTQVAQEQEKNIIPFFIDIDIFRTDDLNIASLKESFNQLRLTKNSVFEDCITDKLRQIFNKTPLE